MDRKRHAAYSVGMARAGRAGREDCGMKVESLGHVVLKVRSFERSVPFYTDVLGLKLVGRLDDRMVFFSIRDNHHDVALVRVGDDAPDAPEKAPGLAHVALKIGNDIETLREAKTHLEASGVEIDHLRDHEVSKSIYFSDPDGNLIEVFVDGDPAVWRADPQKVATALPLEL